MGNYENKEIWGIIQLSQGNVNKKCGRQEFDSVCSFGMILLLHHLPTYIYVTGEARFGMASPKSGVSLGPRQKTRKSRSKNRM